MFLGFTFSCEVSMQIICSLKCYSVFTNGEQMTESKRMTQSEKQKDVVFKNKSFGS